MNPKLTKLDLELLIHQTVNYLPSPSSWPQPRQPPPLSYPQAMDVSSETQDLINKGRDIDSDPKPMGPQSSKCNIFLEPLEWIQMLCQLLDGSFVLGVVLVYGLSQGFTGSFSRVVTDYYWKDVQKMQPSAVQMYTGFNYIAPIMKPVWGVLTDVFPIFGYRRRPYFILAGMLLKYILSMFILNSRILLKAINFHVIDFHRNGGVLN